MFLLRKVVDFLLMPATVAMVLVTLGCVCLWVDRARRAGRVMVSTGVLALLVLAWGIPFDFVARSLEGRYLPMLDPARAASVRWVVVLGGGSRAEHALPVSSRPSAASLYRVTEGIRLQRLVPSARLVFSGAAIFDSVSNARVNGALAEAVGVSQDDIVQEERPRTTEEEADAIRRIVGSDPFLLVTSAIHMPRAMMVFRSRGLTPIPAPTDYRFVPSVAGEPRLLPSLGALGLANEAVHELLGIAWARVRGGPK